MEKYVSPTPVRNQESDDGKALVEKNISTDANLPDQVEIIHEKISEKCKTSQTDARIVKVKKLKIKKQGEKRKFPGKSESIKSKRKKKEEKLGISSIQTDSFSKECNEIKILYDASTPQTKSNIKGEGCTPPDNDSDVENNDRPTKGKFSRKAKAIQIECKDALDVLLKFDLNVLNSIDKSIKILKSHSLLNSRYISMEVLSDLICLALESNKESGVVDFEKELSAIITRCVSELCTTPKRTKAGQNITAVFVSSKIKSVSQEEVPSVVPVSDEVLEKQTSESQELEEAMEQKKTNASEESPEKNQEPIVEKSGKNFCITNYFKKLKKNVEEKDKNERFSCFSTKTDMFLAPKLGGELTGERREKFEEEFISQDFTSSYLAERSHKHKKHKALAKSTKESPSSKVFSKNSAPGVPSISESEPSERKRVSLIRVEKPKVGPIEAVGKTKAKLLQFHDNRRPPYWGTWRRKSESIGPRRPFGKDKMFNYEVDSDDEWEEEEEPGESLHGSDDEKEPEEDYEVDNEFFVPHGYLSDDENPEKENSIPKTKLDLLEEQFTSEQKQKTRKMTPIVFGTFWAHSGFASEGTLYQDLQIDKLQYVAWAATPIDVVEEEEKKSENLQDSEPGSQSKKPKRKIFPDEEIPNLIKMIHGSPRNSDHLARKFLLYWETERIPNGNQPGLTKVCVQKKIKELAAWQTSQEKGKWCWQVPKETREEFGAEVESETPEKKPRKCFIWKFVRKAPKNPEAGNSLPPPPSAPDVEPEIIILNS